MDEWKNQLKNLFKPDLDLVELKKRQEEQALIDKRDAERFILYIALPAFEEIRAEFFKYNKAIEITRDSDFINLNVFSLSGFKEYTYKVTIEGRLPMIETHSQLKDEKVFALSKTNNNPLTIDEISKQYLADHFVERYSNYKKYFREPR